MREELKVQDLVFVGFNARIAALRQETGELQWSWKVPKTLIGNSFVALLLDGERLIASVNGYTYCLDALSGRELWNNPLSGFGTGVPCLTSFGGNSLAFSVLAQAQKDQAARASHPNAGGIG